MKTIATINAPSAIGPYVQGVDLGDMIITSGQLPIDLKSNKLAEGVENQTVQSLNNALAIIEEAGLVAGNIVKTTVFVTDLNDFQKVNQAYMHWFDKMNAPYPARSCVQVARLPMDAEIEIEVIAVR